MLGYRNAVRAPKVLLGRERIVHTTLQVQCITTQHRILLAHRPALALHMAACAVPGSHTAAPPPGNAQGDP